jgi:hypothetical protein
MIKNVALHISARQYLYAQFEADQAVKRSIDDATVDYLRAEALRLIAENPKNAEAFRQRKQPTATVVAKYTSAAHTNFIKAFTAYTRAIQRDSTCYKAHRGLGLTAIAPKDTIRAKTELNWYLASNRLIPDRRFITNILKELDNAQK